MRRGLLKDLANTPTQIACGWRLYGDLPRLRQLAGSVIAIDLLTAAATVEGQQLAPPLQIADETSRWLQDRLQRDAVPAGTVTAARLTLRVDHDKARMLTVDCATTLETKTKTYDSRDVTRWGPDD